MPGWCSWLSVRLLVLAQAMISESWDWAPCRVGLCGESAWDSFSPSAPPHIQSHMYHLSRKKERVINSNFDVPSGKKEANEIEEPPASCSTFVLCPQEMALPLSGPPASASLPSPPLALSVHLFITEAQSRAKVIFVPWSKFTLENMSARLLPERPKPVAQDAHSISGSRGSPQG